MVNLFTTFYNEKDPVRFKELRDCLALNVECSAIDKIYIWLENMSDIPVKSEKIILIPVTVRPLYNDIFTGINRVTGNNDINVIANTDIFFKDDFEIVKKIDLESKCLALTRWDINENSEPEFMARVDSQDAWVFKGKIREISGDFFLGTLGCDNKIAYEIQKAGYRMVNPSLTLKSFHLHLSQYRSGLSSFSGIPHPGPYLYIPISTHERTFKNFLVRCFGKNIINKKNNNFLMHRLYESWLKEMINKKNKDFSKQVKLLWKCFYYRPNFKKKYRNYYFRKLLKPSIKNWLY